MSATHDVARFAATTSYASFPPEVRERAKHAIIDAIGTVACGLNEPSVQHLRALAERETRAGQATVLGTPLRLAASGAALANGSAAHALDYDSISLTVSGFIASPVLFALLAVAEEIGDVSGERLLEAFVTGWEAEAALARGLGVHHYAKGWHSTATLGHFGAAIAVGRLLAFDTARMRYVIGVAASEASGLRTMIGNMANPFHVGKAARNGVVAARLVESGFVAHPDVLDTAWGFCEVFNGPGHYDLQAMTAPLGSAYDLLDPGLVIKVYPCCGLIHSALDGVLDLIERHGIAAAQVHAATIAVHALVPRTMQFDHPTTGYEAKFSTPFCVATAFIERSVRLEHFTDARVRDPAVQAVMAKIRMVVHPALHGADTFLQHEFTEVTLELVDGRVFTECVRRIANRGSRDRPVTLDELESKFLDCAAASGAEDAARDTFGRLVRLECIADIREVTATLHR